MTKDFKTAWKYYKKEVVINFAAALVATVWIVTLWYGGLFATVQCDPKGIDKEFLFCFLHPLKTWDIIGLIVSSVGAIALAFPIHYFSDWWSDVGISWRVIGGITVLIGHAAIFLL